MTKILTKKEYNQLPEDERQMALLINDIVVAKDNIAKNILEIGQKLYIAKDIVPHGEWETWLAEKVDFSIRTARNYISVYKFQCDFVTTDEKEHLILGMDNSKLIELSTLPIKNADEFINEKTIDNIREMSVRELKEEIKQFKKSKKKSADVCLSETENEVIDVDFKESHETGQPLTEEQKLAQLIKEQQELEQQLKLKQRQAKETKESILRNKKSLDLKVEFEELVEEGLFHTKSLSYHIYLVRNGNTKELIIEKTHYSFFEKIDIDDTCNHFVRNVNKIKSLLQEEKDFILGECLKFKDTAIKRGEEVYSESNLGDDFYADLQDKINNELNRRKLEPQENQDLKKEFIIAGYKALAKKYHPDCNLGDAEAEDKFKAVGIFKDILLQQNLLN